MSLSIVAPATVLIWLGAGCILGALPLCLQWVPANFIYGIRIAAAFRSEYHWYAVNRFGGFRLLRFGAITAAMGLALDHYPQAPFWLPILALVATLPLLLLTVRAIERYAASL